MSRSTREHTAPALTFLLAVAAYARTLAPTVTFEDSGELATAAWIGGVAHAPGYPLYTMVARVFAALPMGTVASRIALLSAVGMAMGAAFVAASVQRALRGSGTSFTRAAAALAAGLVAAYGYEAWQQAVIVEVYGLNFAFAGALLWLAVCWLQSPADADRRRILPATSLVLGLAAAHHPTALVLAPALLAYAVLTGLPRVLDLRTALLAVAAFAAGLLPLAYLPLASAADPALDWGDPDTLRNFLRVLGRAQYGLSPWPGVGDAASRVARFGSLLVQQWPLPLCLLPLAGIAWLWRVQRALLGLAALLFIAAGPLTAVLVDTPLPAGDALVDSENRALVSVFFIPAYGVLAFVAGCGLGGALAEVPSRARLALAALTLGVPLWLVAAHGPRLDLSAHHWAEAYTSNLFHDTSAGALVLMSGDPFYFPALYAQLVERQRPDLLIVDTELLRRSWYVRQLLRHAPLMRAVQREADAFIAAAAPFEDGAPYDGIALETAYIGLQRALIEAARAQGREVLTTQAPVADVLRDDVLAPRVAAWSLQRRDSGVQVPPLALTDYRLAEFMDPRVANDRMAVMMRRHFGEMLRERALRLPAGSAAAAETAHRASALLQPVQADTDR